MAKEIAKTTGGHASPFEDHFADVSKMIETRQRRRLGNSPTFTKKKGE
jgi:hypothetical protein